MKLAFLDLETRSLCDLRKYGGRIYAADPSTEILCAVAWVDGVYHLWTPTPCLTVNWPLGLTEEPFAHHSGSMPAIMREALAAGPVVAHNGDDFDFRVLRAKGYDLGETIDTLPMARAAGYPGALDELSKRFLGIGKDATASRILSKCCKVDAPPAPGHLAVIASYNIADVVALRRIYEKVADFAEEPLYSVHRIINERGVRFDRRFASTVLRLANENVKRAGEEILRLTKGFLRPEDLTKRNRVLQWCMKQGLTLENLRRETVDRLIDDPESGDWDEIPSDPDE